jgi:hypothetical protein
MPSHGKSSHGLWPGELKRGCHGRDRMVVVFTTVSSIISDIPILDFLEVETLQLIHIDF